MSVPFWSRRWVLNSRAQKGEHFFRSTLVQTLFYGVFSAWVLWSKKHPAADQHARFNWHESAWSLRVPMIRALFEQVATPSKLGPLGLVEVLDWTGGVLNRVDREAFFERFSESHAVQYFYEPFLEAFDPVLRKDLGVWYTPTEVVKYMVGASTGPAAGLGDRRRPCRSASVCARPLLRHWRISGRGCAPNP